MSRSGYTEDLDQWELAMWRGQVKSATRGKRGQRMFVELKAALEAMSSKRLVKDDLVTDGGDVCALGALGKARGVPMDQLDVLDPDEIGKAFDIAPQLAQEVVFMNDNPWITAEERWTRMHNWVVLQITRPADGS